MSQPLDKPEQPQLLPIIQIAKKLYNNLKLLYSLKQDQKFQYQKVHNFRIRSFQQPTT